jgi:hypothetical protein
VAGGAHDSVPGPADLEDERMLRVVAENERIYRLEGADGTVIGRIRDNTIAFCGLDDEQRTMMGAATAWRSLDAVLRREYAGWPCYGPAIEQLHVMHDGGQAWIADATRRLARLRRVDDVPPGWAAFRSSSICRPTCRCAPCSWPPRP